MATQAVRDRGGTPAPGTSTTEPEAHSDRGNDRIPTHSVFRLWAKTKQNYICVYVCIYTYIYIHIYIYMWIYIYMYGTQCIKYSTHVHYKVLFVFKSF